MNEPSLVAFAVAGSIVASGGLCAQPTNTTATNAPFGRFGPPPILSPEVHVDRTVTFRVRAPKAGEVRVSGDFGDKAMTNDGAGLWSITVGPLEPDLYGHGFSVDGFRTVDPANASMKPMRWPTTSILEDVMPFVEANYRTRNDRESHAIIGLSMGGGQSLSIGLPHLDRFAWVGGMSSGVRDPEQMFGDALGDAQEVNRKLRLLWIACGKDDFLLKPNQQFDEVLTARGIKHEFKLSEGTHSWPVWRRYLAEFLPRLFTE